MSTLPASIALAEDWPKIKSCSQIGGLRLISENLEEISFQIITDMNAVIKCILYLAEEQNKVRNFACEFGRLNSDILLVL